MSITAARGRQADGILRGGDGDTQRRRQPVAGNDRRVFPEGAALLGCNGMRRGARRAARLLCAVAKGSALLAAALLRAGSGAACFVWSAKNQRRCCAMERSWRRDCLRGRTADCKQVDVVPIIIMHDTPLLPHCV